VGFDDHESHFNLHPTWADRRVLVIGGTGFLGQRLTRRLVHLKAQVTVTVCEQDTPAQITALPKEVSQRKGDVRDFGQIFQLINAVEPEIIFHLAAVGANDPFVSEEAALQVNLHGTLNTLRAVQQAENGCAQRLQRIVVAGTSYEYGSGGVLDPGNVYAASKVAAWAFCRMYYRAYGTPVVVARPFNVYGPGQIGRTLIPSAIRAALNGESYPTTPGEQRRDFVYVNDVIDGFLVIASAAGLEGASLDLGTGQATSVRQVVELIFEMCGGRSRPQIGALPYRPGVVWELVADADRTKRLTGWQARVGLKEGLTSTIRALAAT
jgi:nucleoside-diphosphate-sugar epimerase